VGLLWTRRGLAVTALSAVRWPRTAAAADDGGAFRVGRANAFLVPARVAGHHGLGAGNVGMGDRREPGQAIGEGIAGVVATGEIERAASVLRAGGLVAFPTETVYGLGANAEDPAAVMRIFEVKGRPPAHPLIVHIGHWELLEGWVDEISGTARVLAERFWPGPLTLVLRRGRRVPLEVTGGLETVAVRVPGHPVALALLAAFGGGVAAPSANRFGSVSPTTADHVRAELGDAVDVVLGGGPCQVGVESTIVDATGETPSVLRPGGVTREDLEAVLGRPLAFASVSHIRVPGQHPSHYAPRAQVVLVQPEKLVAEAERAQEQGHRVGVLLPAAFAGAPVRAHAVLALPASMAAYARGLYGFLRELDQRGCDLIIASLPAKDGLGLAIADRLQRAAGPRVIKRAARAASAPNPAGGATIERSHAASAAASSPAAAGTGTVPSGPASG
jgi:L-threonylcarbamoyladenylate synthase